MQFRELRRVLQSIVLATLPTACVGDVVGSVGNSDDCSSEVSRQFAFETPADPPLDLRVESCRLDADACQALCTMLMARAGLGSPTTCEVRFDDVTVHAAASYTTRRDRKSVV